MASQDSRFYEAEFPDVDDLVLVQVKKVDDKAGAYVTLLEYNHKEGMINLSEISKRRIRSMAKELRVGSTEICMVVSVDEEKGYINLSKKRVAQEDIPPTQEKFAKAKAIHGVMQHVATTHGILCTDLQEKVSWPLNIEYSSAFDAFKRHINGEINLWTNIKFNEPGEDLSDKEVDLKKDIETMLQRRLISSIVRLQAKCEVSCYEYEGIDAVKAALTEGFKASKEDCEVSIKLVAHPLFSLSCMCRDKEMGISVLDEAMKHVETSITAARGTFAMKSRPAFIEKDKEDGKKADSEEDSSSSSDEEEQDETMGNVDMNFDEAAMKKLQETEDKED